MKRGLVRLWTGVGVGKTTSALGVALRAVGQGKKVIIIQFLKGRKNIGEIKIAKKLKPLYEIHQFGRREFVDPRKPKREDYELARKGLAFAERCLKKKPFLLILDEINLAAGPKRVDKEVVKGVLDVKDVLALLDKVPPGTNVYLTGRYAPPGLIKKADFVNEIVLKKWKKGVKARAGIEY